jgi:fumarate reductase iron-sulfur subunit
MGRLAKCAKACLAGEYRTVTEKNRASRRTLRFEVFRFNPEDPDSRPHMDAFELEETPYMSLFIALNQIRERLDPSLQFDFVCRAAACGSCGMLVNGRPALACRTVTASLPDRIRLHPLPVFKLIGDLSVDTGTWFRQMAERLQAWIHEREPFDPSAMESRMDDELARSIYEVDRCIECGCCVASCGMANVHTNYVGPAGLDRIARFDMDPRDTRSGENWFEVISTDEGVFGCLGLMACQAVCPKNLPLLEVYAYLRRKMLSSVLFPRSG